MPESKTTERIVSLVNYNGRLIVATPDAVFDITDKDNPIKIFDLRAAQEMELGKKYEMKEIKDV